ncbi:MAG: 50S ribosomal protein L13 [Clostridiales bacterium]|nr:50S ribosomal protein L13 [Clostridiales bacterium]
MRTTFITKPSDVNRKWYLIDASDEILGRLACKISDILRGKNKSIFVFNHDVGDNVIIINSSKIKVTGKKMKNKIYRHHSGYPGGVKDIALQDMLIRKPEYVLRHAIKGMLPKNNLSHMILKKLYIYKDGNYNQTAQKPIFIKLKTNKY